MQPVTPVPVLALLYHNMVRDGFSFWIGKENQIVDVVGFKDFLERRMAGVSEADRVQQMLNMEAASDENGISDFVDNTIGLPPYGRSISPGDAWERTRHIGRPVPMKLLQAYTLKDLSDSMAVVDIRGTITPSTTINDVKQEKSGVRVTVTGGVLQGTRAIYRDSGLPQRSYVERAVDMTVMTTGHHEFKQKKLVRTTVEAFPMQGVGALRGDRSRADGERGAIYLQQQRDRVQRSGQDRRGPLHAAPVLGGAGSVEEAAAAEGFRNIRQSRRTMSRAPRLNVR